MKKIITVLIVALAVCIVVLKFNTKEDILVEEPTEVTEVEKISEAEKILESMTLSDMVYQMMFVSPESITGEEKHTAFNDGTKTALEEFPVGGIVYFAQNFEDREQTIEMISKTQEHSAIPLFIGVDEEGGRVSRLGKNKNMGVVYLPAMSKMENTTEAYQSAYNLAEDLKELGFNVDFAPVADVLVNDKNSEIGDRAFGKDAAWVSSMTSAFVKGLNDGGILATLKHFPGHGSTQKDSHKGYSESTRTYEELKSCEFLPFSAGIEQGADFVMVSHMTLVNAVEEKVPSSMSKEVITDFLKGELGFSGIVITDSFSMGAITENYSAGEAAVRAVMAGADMILMPENVKSAHDAIMQAVEDGKISKEQIEKSVRKIIEIKHGDFGEI